MKVHQAVHDELARQPYPFVFVTISGSHIYGFPSQDSDWDVRGVHVLPVEEVVGLGEGHETIERLVREPVEVDLVTHDLRKFMGLLLKKNGYVLEQLTSPIVVRTSPEHEEMKALVPRIVTKHHAHHYLGFAQTEWKLFEKESPRRVKPLLYVYRVLLTGIHLVRTGEVQPNLVTLSEVFKLPFVDELIARKLEGRERSTLPDVDVETHRKEYERLVAMLETARDESKLPEMPSARRELNDLLVRVRLKR